MRSSKNPLLAKPQRPLFFFALCASAAAEQCACEEQKEKCVCLCADGLRNTFAGSTHTGKRRKGMMREEGGPLGVANVCRRYILRSTGEDKEGVRGGVKNAHTS